MQSPLQSKLVNPFHRHPFLIGRGIRGTVLEPGLSLFPLGLPGHEDQAGHIFFMAEIRHRVHDGCVRIIEIYCTFLKPCSNSMKNQHDQRQCVLLQKSHWDRTKAC